LSKRKNKKLFFFKIVLPDGSIFWSWHGESHQIQQIARTAENAAGLNQSVISILQHWLAERGYLIFLNFFH
jgi:hypothetical protein